MVDIQPSPPGVVVLCSWTRHFTLIVPLSTQMYKWELVNCSRDNMAKGSAGGGGGGGGTCDELISYPWGVGILLVASQYKDRSKRNSHLADYQMILTIRVSPPTQEYKIIKEKR